MRVFRIEIGGVRVYEKVVVQLYVQTFIAVCLQNVDKHRVRIVFKLELVLKAFWLADSAVRLLRYFDCKALSVGYFYACFQRRIRKV